MNPDQFPYVGAPAPNTSAPDKLPPPSMQPQQPITYTPPEPTRQKKQSGIKSIITTVLILASAPLLALFITTFVFQSYEVDGPSMQSTLESGERLVVMKLGKTIANAKGSAYIPPKGSIIIFDNVEGNGKRQLIKRVIGVPGDRVVVKDGEVRVFNAEHPTGYDPDEGNNHGTEVETTPGTADIEVKEGEVFVLGDHRDNSQDSRFFGPVPSNKIVGTLYLRIFPLNKFQKYSFDTNN
jgi:signal peptidase I